MRSHLLSAVVCCALVLGLSGCTLVQATSAGPDAEIEVDVSTAPTPADERYETIDDLVAAYIAAGGSCENWEHTSQVQVEGVLDSGTCGPDSVLSIWQTGEQAEANARGHAEVLGGAKISYSLLIGPNWIVNAPDAALVQEAMGGYYLGRTFD